MWNNLGGKLKGLAKVVCWLGIILSLLTGILACVSGNSTFTFRYNYGSGYNLGQVSGVLAGIIVIVVGCLASWIGAWTLYGLGEVVETAEGKEQQAKGSMWNNIGKRLQTLAKIVCWIGILLSCIIGILAITNRETVAGILMIVLGCLGSWISAWSMCGLGVAAEKAEKSVEI